MKHKIVLGAYSEPGLPFSRQACEALAALGVPSAMRHMKVYGHIPEPTTAELLVHNPDMKVFAPFDGAGVPRHDPRLVKVVESLGAAACRYSNHPSFHFRIVEIEGERYVIRKNRDYVERVVTPTKWTVIP